MYLSQIPELLSEHIDKHITNRLLYLDGKVNGKKFVTRGSIKVTEDSIQLNKVTQVLIKCFILTLSLSCMVSSHLYVDPPLFNTAFI